MSSKQSEPSSGSRWKARLVAASERVGELGRRRRAPQNQPPLAPLTTMSSPGQIADLQQAYGADMAPPADTERS